MPGTTNRQGRLLVRNCFSSLALPLLTSVIRPPNHVESRAPVPSSDRPRRSTPRRWPIAQSPQRTSRGPGQVFRYSTQNRHLECVARFAKLPTDLCPDRRSRDPIRFQSPVCHPLYLPSKIHLNPGRFPRFSTVRLSCRLRCQILSFYDDWLRGHTKPRRRFQLSLLIRFFSSFSSPLANFALIRQL